MHDGFLGLTPWKDFLPGADVRSIDIIGHITKLTGLVATSP